MLDNGFRIFLAVYVMWLLAWFAVGPAIVWLIGHWDAASIQRHFRIGRNIAIALPALVGGAFGLTKIMKIIIDHD